MFGSGFKADGVEAESNRCFLKGLPALRYLWTSFNDFMYMPCKMSMDFAENSSVLSMAVLMNIPKCPCVKFLNKEAIWFHLLFRVVGDKSGSTFFNKKKTKLSLRGKMSFSSSTSFTFSMISSYIEDNPQVLLYISFGAELDMDLKKSKSSVSVGMKGVFYKVGI